MDEDIKKGLKRAVESVEVSVTKSVLRWKYKKEGKQIPLEERLENESRHVADRAHEVIAKRGRNVWEELKKAYLKGDGKKGSG
ncbi:MAG: hypothetical protein ISS61_00620 [Desulfobacteraceae bacterium]|nr:hypothetical protein [Desulfobacteraceae bacterium]